MSDRTSIKRIAGFVGIAITSLALAACGGGGGDSGAPTSPPPPVGSPPPPAPPPPPTPPPPSGSVTLTGNLQYEFVPPNNNCQGLNFAGAFDRPMRGVTVQAIDASNPNTVLGSAASDENGNYTITGLPENTNVNLQVRAELKAGIGNTSWDVEIRDNFVAGASDQDNPSNPPYRNGPLYVLDAGTFNSGTGIVTENVRADSGWTGVAYTNPRAAGPFAIADAIYSGMRFIVDVDPNVDFDSLTAYWSVNNKLITSGALDVTAGELTASFYRGGVRELVLTGDAATDTEEFDDHVTVHEWGHYFEDTLSRSDSTGGPHAIGDRLDARLAFGEGWATALAGMALAEPVYCDTGPAGAGTGFGIGSESGSYDPRGWYDEISVVRFLHDLYDTETDGGADTISIGFGPIYDTMVGAQANTTAFTSIFSFASSLRSSLNAEDAAGLDAQLIREDMTPGFDQWGVGENNNSNNAPDVFPLYTDIPVDGTPVNICVNDQYDRFNGGPERTGNKLSQRRYLRFNAASFATYRFTIDTTTDLQIVDDPDNPSDQSDPDLFVYQRGNLVSFGISGAANTESFDSQNPLPAGLYVADLQEFRFQDRDSPTNFPTRVCFDVSIEPR